MAHGIGDDFLSTLVIAATAKVLVCPSMNTQMYVSQAVQANLESSKQEDARSWSRGQENWPCHTEGPGRFRSRKTL